MPRPSLLRRWSSDTGPLFDALDPVCVYDGDGRATGYLTGEWLTPLVDRLERELRVRFTLVAFQGYRDGRAGCGWHRDDPFDAQAILSLGATRTMGLRCLGEESLVKLHDGDLVWMPSGCQRDWEHCVPAHHTTLERRSLVFRTPRVD